ncbi:hypothetical protein BBJ28_00014790 [Nothophytophthora sp. Chile5]|nr:hypothetical protein BBJ28_00014790 [Nothophytophthora sp. Chile5]
MPALRSRPEATSVRPASTSSSSDQQRRRELVCRLLSQIYTRAERTRAVKTAEHASRRRRQSNDSDEAENAAQQTPLSLIELIQASYAVFERFGIRAPDDAVYHRHLLALTIDPEQDWRKKIRNFDATRVQRLCRTGGQQQAPHRADQVTGVAAPPSILVNNRRRRSNVAPNRSRRLSFASEPPTPLKTPLPASPASVTGHQRDRFGDMLSLESSPATGSKAWGSTAATTPYKESSGRPASRAVTSPILAVGVEGGTLKQRVASIPSAVPSSASATIEGDETSPSTANEAAGSDSNDQFQLLATMFEQWRAMQAVKRLIKQQKDRDLAFQQQLTTPWGIHAVFHWIVLCLPERRDFLATESVQALPMSAIRRVSVANMHVLKQLADRVWRWQVKTLLASWRQNASNTKTFRVRVMIKQRAAVLELAFRCGGQAGGDGDPKETTADLDSVAGAIGHEPRRSLSRLGVCFPSTDRILHAMETLRHGGNRAPLHRFGLSTSPGKAHVGSLLEEIGGEFAGFEVQAA